jgi:sialate O-acetylesterase
MLKTLALPNTGMGINIDIGDTREIHPKNKQEVGRRLSLWALGTVYEKDVLAVSGPLPDGHEIESGRVVLRFKHAQGLQSSDGPLAGFEITGDGETWHPAEAKIEGERVVVSSSQVDRPLAVRYAWENDPKCNLVNAAGLPATPFRTSH